MQIRRRGFEMRLVIQGSRAPAPLADLALIKVIAKGRRWADDLLAGRVESVAAIARREGVLPNYVRRLTRLAFLSPRIVETIVAGQQPPELTREGSHRTHRTAPSLERTGTRGRDQLIFAIEVLTSWFVPSPFSRLAQTVAPNSPTEIFAANALDLPERDFIRDQIFANEAAVVGFSVIRARFCQRLGLDGGEGGIRTPETLSSLHAFQACALSRTLPPLRSECSVCHFDARIRHHGK
jgi:hypothetical protein